MNHFDNTVDHYSELDCIEFFHLKKLELKRLVVALDLPATFVTPGNRSKWTGESALLMYLRRMCTITKYYDLKQEMGGRQVSSMSEMVKMFQQWFYKKYNCLINGQGMTRWSSQLPLWASLISAIVGPYDEAKFGLVCCFVDGTFKRTTCPSGWSYLQRVMWTRYKKSHGLGFLSVVAPNGLTIFFSGPAPGRHNVCDVFVTVAIVCGD